MAEHFQLNQRDAGLNSVYANSLQICISLAQEDVILQHEGPGEQHAKSLCAHVLQDSTQQPRLQKS